MGEAWPAEAGTVPRPCTPSHQLPPVGRGHSRQLSSPRPGGGQRVATRPCSPGRRQRTCRGTGTIIWVLTSSLDQSGVHAREPQHQISGQGRLTPAPSTHREKSLPKSR